MKKFDNICERSAANNLLIGLMVEFQLVLYSD